MQIYVSSPLTIAAKCIASQATYTSLPFPGRVAGLVYSKASRWHEEVLPQEPLSASVKSQFCVSPPPPHLCLLATPLRSLFLDVANAATKGGRCSLKYVRLVVSHPCNDSSAKSPAQNHQPSSQPVRPGSARILIYAIPLSSAARTPVFRSLRRFPFLRPFHRIPRRRELRRTRRTRRERFAGAPPLAFVCVYSAHECVNYYGPGGGLLLIGLLTSCSLCSRRRKSERASERKTQLAFSSRARYTVRLVLACNLRVRASENRGNFYQPHLIIAKTFLLFSSLSSLYLSSLYLPSAACTVTYGYVI